jgi:hypothetical protein
VLQKATAATKTDMSIIGLNDLRAELDEMKAGRVPFETFSGTIKFPSASPEMTSTMEDFGNNNELNTYCISIFDTQTEKLVSQEGYAVVDLPRRGSVARFGTYTARYIGTGA